MSHKKSDTTLTSLHFILFLQYINFFIHISSHLSIFNGFCLLCHLWKSILHYKIIKIFIYRSLRASLVAQLVKNPPAMQETWIRSLGREDPLEKGMATHSSILAWRITMDRGAWQAIVHGVSKSWTQLATKYSTANV